MADTTTDRIAICGLKARYCRFLDSNQWDAWTELFAEDFVLDTQASGGPPPITGRAEAIALARATTATAHIAQRVHTPELYIDGDSVEGVWAMQDRVIREGGMALTGYGHYTETYVTRDGEWRIAPSRLTRRHVDFTAAPAA